MFQPFATFKVSCCVYLLWTFVGVAAENEKKRPTKVAEPHPLAAVLPAEKWLRVEKAVDRALAWLADREAANGAFPAYPSGQPAITSLCAMAFLSRGHQPGIGAYGQGLNKAIDFVLSCQRDDGVFSYQEPGPMHQDKEASHTAVYNHAISGLMLGEAYGQISGARAKRVKTAIELALKFSLELQSRPKRLLDKGGWRYLAAFPSGINSDLSVTGWELMFLRSAKNAEFPVPEKSVKEAIDYVHEMWDPASGAFNYALPTDPRIGPRITRGMTGAGILCLSMAGQHETIVARSAGTWLLEHPFQYFGETVPRNGRDDRFLYSVYYCSQAMAQLGGRYWERFFPKIVELLLENQAQDGSWPSEPNSGDGIFGNAYSTALAVLSLTPPYQLLPVYQR